MYTLPDDFDLQFLSGCHLAMVCCGKGVTGLDFSRVQSAIGVPPYRVSISVEGDLSYRVNNTLGNREFEHSVTSAPLLDLLLKDVTEVVKIGPESLQISFGSEDYILIGGDCDSGHESYSIYLSSGDIIFV